MQQLVIKAPFKTSGLNLEEISDMFWKIQLQGLELKFIRRAHVCQEKAAELVLSKIRQLMLRKLVKTSILIQLTSELFETTVMNL